MPTDGWASGGAVEIFLDLHFDERALLLDHHDQVQALAEGHHAVRLQRIGHGDLVEADAEVCGAHLVDAEEVERFGDVLIALAGGDDTDARLLTAGQDDPVELIGAGEGEDSRALIVMEPRFLGERRIIDTDIEPAVRHLEIGRSNRGDAPDPPIDHRGLLDIVLHAFEAHPDAGKARHCEPVKAVIENLLHIRRIEDRDHRVDEGEFGLMRGG